MTPLEWILFATLSIIVVALLVQLTRERAKARAYKRRFKEVAHEKNRQAEELERSIEELQRMKDVIAGLRDTVLGLALCVILKEEECNNLGLKLGKLEKFDSWLEEKSADDAFRIGVAKVAIPELLSIVSSLKAYVEDLATRLAREKKANAALTGLQRLIERLQKALSSLSNGLGSQH